MASIEQALRDKLLADADVSALVGARVYPVVLPRNTAYPATTVQQISEARVYAMGTKGLLPASRFQFTHWSPSYGTVKDLSAKARKALDGFSGVQSSITIQLIRFAGEIDLYEPLGEVHKIAMDMIVSYDSG